MWVNTDTHSEILQWLLHQKEKQNFPFTVASEVESFLTHQRGTDTKCPLQVKRDLYQFAWQPHNDIAVQ